MSLNLWLDILGELALSQDNVEVSSGYSELFTLDIYEAQVSSLQNDIWDRSLDINKEVADQSLYDGDWPGFEQLVRSYLKFCKNVNPNDERSSYDLYALFLVDLQTAFTNSRGSSLVQVVVKTARTVIPMAVKLDAEDMRSSRSPEPIRCSHIAAVLLRIFNSIRAEKPDPSNGPVRNTKISTNTASTKKSIILFIAVTLCRLYHHVGQLPSSANVFSNIHTAQISFKSYPMSQQVEYRFWLGRYYLLKNQLANAYCHLYWSFVNCHQQSRKNEQLILKFLIPCAMLLGKMPVLNLLRNYDLEGRYKPLMTLLREPHFNNMLNYLNSDRQWFQSRGLYMLLMTKSILVMLRVLVYRLWRIEDRSSTLHFDQLITALQLAKFPGLDQAGGPSPENSYNNLFAENVLISLASQGLVKGKIFTRTKVIRLRATDPLPRLSLLYNIDGSEPVAVAGKEKWMDT